MCVCAACVWRQVYAVEASSMAHHARRLMEANGLSGMCPMSMQCGASCAEADTTLRALM